MKKFLFYSALIVLLGACASVRPVPKSVATVIDYSPLTQQGIFVTESNSVSFDYEAVGSVFIAELGGWVRKNGKAPSGDPKEDYYLSSANKKVYQSPSLEVAFKNLTEKLKAMDANGIVNLKISTSLELDLIYKVHVDKITITGMAIKK
jgi:hypothetical protein